ncbi:hypothetical protein OEZ49_02060 [Ruegeria sp. WL0004]|uniref:Uncharacterized protein n=1 Tax=Ruegeria marisflavi TaxID=2984152 RepID=A0ABT2WKW0_9RHOB|nr:hypothetical protein [Ruegeria sp. WL0004]
MQGFDADHRNGPIPMQSHSRADPRLGRCNPKKTRLNEPDAAFGLHSRRPQTGHRGRPRRSCNRIFAGFFASEAEKLLAIGFLTPKENVGFFPQSGHPNRNEQLTNPDTPHFSA